MNMEFFAESMAEICNHSLVAQGRPLRWVIIANPGAGGFTISSRWKKIRRALDDCLIAAKANPLREDSTPAGTAVNYTATVNTAQEPAKTNSIENPVFSTYGLVPTKGPGCAINITTALLEEASKNQNDITAVSKTVPFYLIITAGGDGTSLEALSVLYNAPLSLRSNAAVLRLPMGTGNDGADSPDLATALALLIKPSRIEYTPALRLIPAQSGPLCKQYGDVSPNGDNTKSPFLAFNILSVGIDAFITHMTNKMKGKLPGDFYKLWVDIASLLYDRLYTVGFLDVRALDKQGGEVRSFREKLLLLAVGISGHRTYGSQKKILPDDRNICAVKQMSLLRKLALKGLFTTGTHINKPEAILFNAHRVEFSGEHPILAQMDGEAILLQPDDFPAVIEMTEPLIPVLKLV
jgi:diacylglycerol kinase family enzyme